jgi:phytoene dehydrogenase-like protein
MNLPVLDDSKRVKTTEQYTLKLTGSIYGWEGHARPDGTGQDVLETPMRGLYLSGHWTQSGCGIYGVVSGILTAQAVLGRDLFEEIAGCAT